MSLPASTVGEKWKPAATSTSEWPLKPGLASCGHMPAYVALRALTRAPEST